MPACARCSAEFDKRRRGQNRYCKPCQKDAYRERDKLRWLERTGCVPVGALVKCAGCDATFTKPSNHRRFCDRCVEARGRLRLKLYRERNIEAARARDKRTNAKRKGDPARLLKMRVYSKTYAEKNRDNITRCLNRRMRERLRQALITGKQGRSWTTFVNYSVDELRRHLERQFVKGMSWKNMGRWHIDHIVPLASFGPLESRSAEFQAAWALTNLRPLWAEENIRKQAKRLFLI
jgi:hypothetical protein